MVAYLVVVGQAAEEVVGDGQVVAAAVLEALEVEALAVAVQAEAGK